MSKRLPWMKWYSKDAIGDTALRLCPPAARGIWYDMLWLMDVADRRGYLTRNGCPYPDADICRVLGVTTDELAKAKDDLIQAGVPGIEKETGIWFNRRMVRDEERRLNGAKYGSKGGGNPQLKTPLDNPQETIQIPENRSQKLEVTARARTPIKDTFIGAPKENSDFEAFWDEYGKKLSRGSALRAFKTAMKKTTIAEMIQAIQAQKNTHVWRSGYQPHAATWLNQEQWTNDIAAMNRVAVKGNEEPKKVKHFAN